MSKFTPAYVAIFKQLGGKLNGNALSCTGRSGVVYLRTADGPKPIAVEVKTNKPLVSECEHGATELVLEYVEASAINIALAIVAGKDVSNDMPELVNIFFAYTDEVDKTEVSDLTDAATVIANLMEKS